MFEPETAYPKRSLIRSQLAVATREHKPQSELDALRRDYYAAKLAEHIAAELKKAPPLTPEQADRIRALLRPGGDAA